MANRTNLRNLRINKLKLSQSALAEKLGVDQSTVSAWEKYGLPKRDLIRQAIEKRLADLLLEQAA